MAVSLVLAVAVAALGGLWFDRASDATERAHVATAPPSTMQRSNHAAKRTLRLTVRRDGRLPAAVQDSAVTVIGDTAYVFGGLDAAGSSVGTVSRIREAVIRTIGRLPVPLHDAAAATVAGRLYVLGGGQVTSASGIGLFRPSTGRTRLVGALPTPLSDLSATSANGTTYVVGGFTGSAWSDAIYSFSGSLVRRVGRLPVPTRYAAVATMGNDIVIAGGRTQAGPTAAIYRFTPGSGRVGRIGTLPQPLMHASAGTLNGTMYVVGGLGAGNRPMRSVVGIRSDGSAKLAARLPTPLSDAPVATLPDRLLIVGGSTGARPTSAVESLSFQPAAAPNDPPARTTTTATAGLAAGFGGPLPGDLLIADRGNDRILVVDPRHRIIWKYPHNRSQARLYFDDDTFFAPGGRSIISNQEENHQIVQISYPGGHVIWRYGHAGVRGSGTGYLNTPDDAYRLANGTVIVADAYNCRVLEIRHRRVIRSIGQAGHCVHDPPRYLGAVNGDTPLPNGHLLVSEIAGSYIDEFTMSGRLVRVYRAPVAYPSDPQVTRDGNILLADYANPGGVVILSRRTGRLLWRYQPTSGPGRLDHPSLAAMLPNGMIAVTDDYNDRIVIIDPRTRRIVWHYGHLATPGRGAGYLNTPDGFDFVPVTADGRPDPARITHGP
jgi:outer membrane protein assembly factor BamB